MSKFQEILLTVLISVLVSGGATYVYFSNKVSNLEGKAENYATKEGLAEVKGLLSGFASDSELSELKGTVDQYKETFDSSDRVSLLGTIARESQKETRAHLSDKDFVVELIEPTVLELFGKHAENNLSENAKKSIQSALDEGTLEGLIEKKYMITKISNDHSKCAIFEDLQICWGSKILTRGGHANSDHTASFNFVFPKPFSDFPTISNGINMNGSGHFLGVYTWRQDLSKAQYTGTLNNAYLAEAIGGTISMNYIAVGSS